MVVIIFWFGDLVKHITLFRCITEDNSVSLRLYPHCISNLYVSSVTWQ